MLFVPKHGVSVVPDDYDTSSAVYKGNTMQVSYACGFEDPDDYPKDPIFGRFDYLFSEAEVFPVADDMTKNLDDLAAAMVEPAPDGEQNSQIAPVFTYFGQFIDHDITANTDRETGLSEIDVVMVEPVERSKVSASLQNLRQATLNLDSVHGGGPLQGPVAEKLDAALRFPKNKAKLWAGTVSKSDFDQIPFPKDPKDPARDLLRADRFLKDETEVLNESFLRSLPDALRTLFVNDDDSMRPQRAIIGDMRNDENLIVAQFHLAMVRLHNRIVDHASEHPDAPKHDKDALFDWARQRLSWHYQWLVLNTYLPAICDHQTLKAIQDRGPVVYNRFLAQVGTPKHPKSLLPMPLEFSVAGFRFGHTMVRDSYDWSFQFGRPEDKGLLPRANFLQLFLFTGNGATPMGGAARLPQHWPIDWSRFVQPPTADKPDRSARKIDTRIAVNLKDMLNEDSGMSGQMAQLAARNLRRGYKLNLPSAQQCLKQLKQNDGIELPELSREQLRSGPTQDAIAKGHFDVHTPLWFYVLKEAEELGEDGRLGPLGTVIIADTLMGLIVNDEDSYWNASEQQAAWHPKDGVKPDGVVIDSMAAMMEAARLL